MGKIQLKTEISNEFVSWLVFMLSRIVLQDCLGIGSCQIKNKLKDDDRLTIANRLSAVILQHLIDDINSIILANI